MAAGDGNVGIGTNVRELEMVMMLKQYQVSVRINTDMRPDIFHYFYDTLEAAEDKAARIMRNVGNELCQITITREWE